MAVIESNGNWRLANLVALLLTFCCGAIYVSQAWSPSSYGYVLTNVLGHRDQGPVWSSPKTVRSDEWADVTPLTQATVNNGYERFNKTSLYGEDLRINHGLPLWDWGRVFKPTMWLYGAVNPAYAFSCHWFMLCALFVVGHAWLLRWLGATPGVGFALAIAILFSGFVQFWWNEKASEFALFPWVLLPFATRLPMVGKAVLAYWWAVAWLLTNFYPPIQIPLAYVGAVVLFARAPALFNARGLPILILAMVLAAGTAAFYLWDYLQATATTIYPGRRVVSGGPGTLASYWPGGLFPAANIGRECIVPGLDASVCEMGVFGTHYLLLGACFLDFREWRRIRESELRRCLVVIGLGWLCVMAWLALPLPSAIGAPLMWNRIQPERMQYAAGLLSVFLMFLLVSKMGLRMTWLRLAVFVGLTAAAWWVLKSELPATRWEDFLVLAFVLPAFAVARRWPAGAHAALAWAAALPCVLLFAAFNPLQSAWPIFNRVPNEVTGALDQLAKNNNDVLAVAGLPGAVANGLGYASVSHLTAVPQLQFWQHRFPDLPADDLERVFNRFAHIVPDGVGSPRVLLDHAIAVPIHQFQRSLATLTVDSEVPPPAPLGDQLDAVVSDGRTLWISGWAPWTGPPERHALEIHLRPPASGVPNRAIVIRPDLPTKTGRAMSVFNGFLLQIPYDAAESPALCLVALDEPSGMRWLLPNPPGVRSCR